MNSMWRRLFARVPAQPTRTKRPRPQPARPRLEGLEERLAPATNIWIGLTDGSWGTASNWSLARTPQAGDDLTFGPTTGTKFTTNNITSLPTLRSITVSASGYTIAGTEPIPFSGSFVVNATLGNELVTADLQLLPPSSSLQQTLTVNTGSDLIITGHLTGGANVAQQTLTKAGSGTLELQADNRTYTGAITLANSGGIVVMTNAYALGAGAVVPGTPNAGVTTVNANAQLQIRNVTGSITERLRLNGSGLTGDGALLNFSGNNTWDGDVELDSDTTIGVAASTRLTISGQISDLGSGRNLTKVLDGNLIFSHVGGNTYRGTTTIDDGILTIQDPLSLGAGADATKSQSGTVAAQTVVNYNPITGDAGTLQFQFVTLAANDPSGLLKDPSKPFDAGTNPYVGLQVFNDRVVLNGPGFGGIGALHNLAGNNSWDGEVILGSPPPPAAATSTSASRRTPT